MSINAQSDKEKAYDEKRKKKLQRIYLLSPLLVIIILICAFFALKMQMGGVQVVPEKSMLVFDPMLTRISPKDLVLTPINDGFESPLGGENGAFTYQAAGFMTKTPDGLHLGSDLNGIGGGDTDLGMNVYATANGRVIYSGNAQGGWGEMIILSHRIEENGKQRFILSCYAHLQNRLAFTGKNVARGEVIGNLGKSGTQGAHLHFELRDYDLIATGSGYIPADGNQSGRLDPQAFLASHKPTSLLPAIPNTADTINLEVKITTPDP